jgi:DNA anti-recombination protein RmuC
MYKVRESWTDGRLDDFAKHVDRRFDEVDRKFAEVDKKFDKVDKRFDNVDHELHRINDRLDAMARQMVYGVLTMSGSILALIGVVVAH